ncbi:hypothetical protein EST38_g11908 [Candolleomyces aberdarensis]|uniref:Uncharacterized protein n=1 Tax=Candolleomyces aberdarensis TaxID=2316362 RepID=A0A4Q2D607_9AGAR|nr:hypothetical protein EST38_g11908 [Candolleomyces aberdarensis]
MPAERSAKERSLDDLNALVSLLTSSPPQGEGAQDRTVAATGSLEEFRTHVKWEDHASQLLKLVNNWPEMQSESETMKYIHLFYLVLTRGYGKLALRMNTGRKYWGNHPFEIITEYLASRESGVKFDAFQVSVPTTTTRKVLAQNGINPVPGSSQMYSVDSTSVAKWFGLLRHYYSVLWNSIVRPGTTEAKDELSNEDLKEALKALLVLYDVVYTDIVPRVVRSCSGLVKSLNENAIKVKGAAADQSSQPQSTTPGGTIHLADDDMTDFASEVEVSKRLDCFLRSTVSLVWAIDHLHLHYLNALHPPVDAKIVKVAAEAKSVTLQDRRDLVAHFQNRYQGREEHKTTLKWLDKEARKPYTGPHARQHAEAILMGKIFQSRFDFGSDTPVASGRRYCYCCYKLATLLNDSGEAHLPEFTSPGTHGVVHPWTPPPGIPDRVLEKLRDDLWAVAATQAKRDRKSTKSGGLRREELPPAPIFGVPLADVVDKMDFNFIP